MKTWQQSITKAACSILNHQKGDREAVIAWLEDCKKDALIHDPSVGLYTSEPMADIFQHLITIVEG